MMPPLPMTFGKLVVLEVMANAPTVMPWVVPMRDVMIERGLERVRLFSWKSTVDRHLDVYRRLV